MLTVTRQNIADALSGIDGITGYAKRPAAAKAGDAWPLVSSLNRGPGLTFEVSWAVTVLLAGDENTALDQVEAWLPDLVADLSSVLYVDSATPVEVSTEAGPRFGLQLLARSE